MAKKQTPQEEKALARKSAALPATVSPMAGLMSEDARDGMQAIRPEDMAIPFLQIIQSLSPQRKKNNEKYIQGAEEGMIFNSVNNDLYSECTVVPVSFVKQFIEWRPRADGGGFVGAHDRFAPIVENTRPNKDGKRITDDGNELIETAQYYVLVWDEETGAVSRAVISMSGSQLKKSRKWNTMMDELKVTGADGKLFTPPMYAHSYVLSTKEESNDKGAWSGWVIEMGRMLTDRDLYLMSRAFSKAVSANEVKVDQAKAVDVPLERDDNTSAY